MASSIIVQMPTGLSSTIKTLVIQQWLQGKPRNDIAAENGVSSGAVTNIVNEWKLKLGLAAADELRELAVTMKKVGITAAQCALGSRIATIMLRIGVKEEDFESFVSGVYNQCKDIGLSPENISSILADLLEFSKTVPLPKIPDYIRQKANEKIKLDQDLENLKVEADALRKLRDAALEDNRMTNSELKSYADLREELGKYGIPIDDTSKFAKVVNNIREYGYDPGRVMREFSDLESLRISHQFLQQNLQSMENKVTELRKVHDTLQLRANMHTQFLQKYDRLVDMGFGLKELDSLWNTVNEIARENNIPLDKAVTKFLSDVERHYNNKLGFEAKVESLRNELNKLYQEEARLRTGLLTLPLVGPKLVKLTQNGVTEQDIINIAGVFEKYVAGEDRQSFISELESYGSLKSAIQELRKQSERMKIQVPSVQTKIQDNQLIKGSRMESKNKSVEIDSDILNTPEDEFADIREMQENDILLPLVKAARGEEVKVNRVKDAILKTLELVICKIGSDKHHMPLGMQGI